MNTNAGKDFEDDEGEDDGDELEDDTDADADDLYCLVWIWMDPGQDKCILWPPINWLNEREKEKVLYFAATAG